MPKRRLIVLGSGFAGFSLVKSVDTASYDVAIVSPRNHFLFTPLLPSTTVGTIEFRSIIEPIRGARKGIEYYQASCTSVDPQRNVIGCRHAIDEREFSLPYDVLVIAVGAENNTYGIPGVAEHALFLRELADARAIRQRIIECFERASIPEMEESERSSLLRFLVVGGGPTGVEFAAELHDFLAGDVAKRFPRLRAAVHITLLEGTHQILNTFDQALGAYTLRQFRRSNIEVRLGSIVTRVEAGQVHLGDGSVIPYGLLVWSTGIGPTGVVRSLPFEKERKSRLVVDEYFRVRGQTQIYAAGDCASMAGQQYAATAQVAQQEGKYLARQLNRIARGKRPEPFHYKDLGMLAYIGGNRALADLPGVKGSGFLTWLFWRSVYLTRLVSFKNKILVVFDWIKAVLFGRDVSRF